MEPQIQQLLEEVCGVLGDELVGAYLHGSAVLGGLRPRSDIDLLVVTARRTTPAENRKLIDLLLDLSMSPRPIELDVVVASEIRPWRYPPRLDFQYSEWWRKAFEAGELEPWSETSRDLASLVRMVLAGNTALHGPAPAEVFDPVPRGDYVDALLKDFPEPLRDLDSDTRNVVLTLARIWSGIATDEVHSKDGAATWALERLP
ncbi:N/A [soil metagenome]